MRYFYVQNTSRGQSLVEFALILPVFMLFFATTLDLGRLAAAQLSVANAAKEGAFQAATTPTDLDTSNPCPAAGDSNLILCRVQLELNGSGISVNPSDIDRASVWSDYGNGYGFVPLVLPFVGLWWLWRVGRADRAGPAS